jgi:hypothetical protein
MIHSSNIINYTSHVNNYVVPKKHLSYQKEDTVTVILLVYILYIVFPNQHLCLRLVYIKYILLQQNFDTDLIQEI